MTVPTQQIWHARLTDRLRDTGLLRRHAKLRVWARPDLNQGLLGDNGHGGSSHLACHPIGSYSFVKYSKIAYSYGIASSQTYLNDWFWIPLLLFGWLPILYFSRVVSIPEYFERRFGSVERQVATAILLVYLIGYVGINLFTMGQALNILLGIPIFTSAAVVAAVSATYVTRGGQTSSS